MMLDYSAAAAPTVASAERLNLRLWFGGYVLWMIALTVGALWGLREIDGGGSSFGWVAWVFCGYAFYMSLCCTFFPAPTTWVVMLAASDLIVAQMGLSASPVVRLVLVATVGALGTCMANLNEYHLFVYLLRRKRVGRVRDTHLFRTASGWFRTNPFWIMVLFSFLPIPVDVVRWLAITAGYPRRRFFTSTFLGRWGRYAIWAGLSAGLNLGVRQIMIIQVVLGAGLLARIISGFVRRAREQKSALPVAARQTADELSWACRASAGSPQRSGEASERGVSGEMREPVPRGQGVAPWRSRL